MHTLLTLLSVSLACTQIYFAQIQTQAVVPLRRAVLPVWGVFQLFSAQIAREWYDSGVVAIADVVNSSIALGVQDLAGQKKRFALLSGPGTVDITGPRCNPYSYLWTWDTYADATVPVRAIVAEGGRKWFFLTADFAFGAFARPKPGRSAPPLVPPASASPRRGSAHRAPVKMPGGMAEDRHHHRKAHKQR